MKTKTTPTTPTGASKPAIKVTPKTSSKARPKPAPKPASTAASKTASKAVPKASPKVPAKAAEPVKAKPVKPVKSAKPAKPPKEKLIRDGFTMPESEFQQIQAIKVRAMAFKREVKKSEVLRAGLKALQGLSADQLQAVLESLPTVKTGRPKKGH